MLYFKSILDLPATEDFPRNYSIYFKTSGDFNRVFEYPEDDDSDWPHEDDESRRAPRPKWRGGDIFLVLNCVSCQYSRISFGTRAR